MIGHKNMLGRNCVNDTHNVISDANKIQHIFSQDCLVTLWQVIPAFEELQTAWKTKQKLPKFVPYKDATQNGLDKIHKYYNKFDEKPVHVTVQMDPYPFPPHVTL